MGEHHTVNHRLDEAVQQVEGRLRTQLVLQRNQHNEALAGFNIRLKELEDKIEQLRTDEGLRVLGILSRLEVLERPSWWRRLLKR